MMNGVYGHAMRIFCVGVVFALADLASYGEAHRFTVSVNYNGAPTADVPAALRISETSVPGFSYADAGDGTHFTITDGTGAVLPYEIDTWDPGGESLIWVKIPYFVNGKKLTVVYGETEADMTVRAAEVWSNYIGVWHMNAVNALGKYPNSAGDARFDAEVSSFSRIGEAGKFGQSALIFTNAYHGAKADKELGGVFVPDGGNLDLSGDFAVSGWFYHVMVNNPDNDSKAFRWDNLFCKRKHPETGNSANGGDTSGFGARIGVNAETVSAMEAYASSPNSNTAKLFVWPSMENASWHHISFSYAEGKVALWFDGALKVQNSVTNNVGVVTDNDMPFSIGNNGTAYLDEPGGKAWGGRADEVRIVRGAPSASWLAAEYAAMTGALVVESDLCTLEIDKNENFGDDVTVSSDVPAVSEGKYRRGTTITLTAVPGATGMFRKWYGDVPREVCTNATVTVTLDSDAWIYARFVHPWTLSLREGGAYGTMTDGCITVNVTNINTTAHTMQVGGYAAGCLVPTSDTGRGVIDLGGAITASNDERPWTITGFAKKKGSQCPPVSLNGNYRGYISPGTATDTNYYQIFHRGDNSEGAAYTDFIIIDEPVLNYFLHDCYMFSSQSEIKRFVLDLPREKKFGSGKTGFLYSMRAHDYLSSTKFDWWYLPCVEVITNQTFASKWGRGDELFLRAPCSGTLSLPSMRGVDWVEGVGTQLCLMPNVTEISLGGFDETTTVTNLGIYAFAGNTNLRKLTLHAATNMTVGSRIFADKKWREWEGYDSTHEDSSNAQTEVIDGITFRVGKDTSRGRVPDVIHFTGQAISEEAIANLLDTCPIVSSAAKPVVIYASRFQDGWRDNRRDWISNSTPAERAACPGEKVIGVYRAGAEAPSGKAVIIHRDNDWDRGTDPGLFIHLR